MSALRQSLADEVLVLGSTEDVLRLATLAICEAIDWLAAETRDVATVLDKINDSLPDVSR